MKIVCLGDSLTQARYLHYQDRWVTLAADKLDLQILNRGIHGDTTTGMIGRFYPHVVQESPDAVFIMGGLNDLWFGAAAGTIIGNLFSMVRMAQYHQIIPVLGLPTPLDDDLLGDQGDMAPFYPEGKGLERYLELIHGIKRFFEADGELCIPMYKGLVHEDGRGKGELFIEDGLHPNREGNKLMFQNFAEGIGQIDWQKEKQRIAELSL